MKINLSAYQHIDKKEEKTKLDVKQYLSFNKFSDKRKEDFYREFSTLIKSGVDFNQALLLLSEQQKSKFLELKYKEISNAIVKGKILFEIMQSSSSFSPYEYYSIKIGEETNRLPIILDQLQKFFSRR